MKWTDSRAIAQTLAAKYPDVDPRQVRFTQLREWVLALDNFDDLPEHCGLWRKNTRGNSSEVDYQR
jgi:FeS assembly protein IscX